MTVVYVMTAQEAAADDDSDGASNWHEFLAGTDRNNPNSVLKLISSGTAQGPGSGIYRISWQSIPGKRYGVYRAASLPGAFTRIGEAVAESDKTWYDDCHPTGSSQYFYTVMVE
jgi:hypothetical protein